MPPPLDPYKYSFLKTLRDRITSRPVLEILAVFVVLAALTAHNRTLPSEETAVKPVLAVVKGSAQPSSDPHALPANKALVTLRGIDADYNGVRDEIDTYISNRFKDEIPRKEIQEFARALQATILVDLKDAESVDKVKEALRAAKGNLKSIPYNATGQIEKITLNSKQRQDAYAAFLKAGA